VTNVDPERKYEPTDRSDTDKKGEEKKNGRGREEEWK